MDSGVDRVVPMGDEERVEFIKNEVGFFHAMFDELVEELKKPEKNELMESYLLTLDRQLFLFRSSIDSEENACASQGLKDAVHSLQTQLDAITTVFEIRGKINMPGDHASESSTQH